MSAALTLMQLQALAPPGGIDNFVLFGSHFDGGNGSTTFTDFSSSPKTITPVGNAQLSTAQSVFGGSSYVSDGTGDSIELASHADWAIPAGTDFCLEFRIRLNAVNTRQDFWMVGTGVALGGLSFQLVSGNLTVGRYGAGTDNTFAWSPSTNTWYAVRVVRVGTSIAAFVDGAQVGSTGSNNISYAQASLRISGDASATNGTCFNGYMDELRYSKGTGREGIAAYVPATRPFL